MRAAVSSTVLNSTPDHQTPVFNVPETAEDAMPIFNAWNVVTATLSMQLDLFLMPPIKPASFTSALFPTFRIQFSARSVSLGVRFARWTAVASLA